MKKFSALLTVLALSALSMTAHAGNSNTTGGDDYDRLDGMGASGKKVNVIEWEGNLEVHVYPKGSLKGLSLKLDKKNKNNPVMVIGYRFDNTPTPLIRRAVLGITMNEGFKTYRDNSADDYDKVIISNNGLSSPLVAFRLDPAPSQLYPDGVTASDVAGNTTSDTTRAPAASDNDDSNQPLINDDDDSRIRPFYYRETPTNRHDN